MYGSFQYTELRLKYGELAKFLRIFVNSSYRNKERFNLNRT